MGQRFSYVRYDAQSIELQNKIRELFENIERKADAGDNVPGVQDAADKCGEFLALNLADGRPKGLALNRLAAAIAPTSLNTPFFFDCLEESYMWVGKAIRDAQIARQGTIDELPDRGDEEKAALEKKFPLLQFFEHAHLKPELQLVSKPFGELAHRLCVSLPVNCESVTMLRKLIEGKDCAVRAKFMKEVPRG